MEDTSDLRKFAVQIAQHLQPTTYVQNTLTSQKEDKSVTKLLTDAETIYQFLIKE